MTHPAGFYVEGQLVTSNIVIEACEGCMQPLTRENGGPKLCDACQEEAVAKAAKKADAPKVEDKK